MDRIRLLKLAVLITVVFASGFAVGYEYRQAYNTAYSAVTVKVAQQHRYTKLVYSKFS